jgi:hypothetical protein
MEQKIIEEIKEILTERNFVSKVAVPFKIHYCNYTENQSSDGLVKSFSVLNLSSGDYYKIKILAKNDFYSITKLTFEFVKILNLKQNTSLDKFESTLMTGNNLECINVFEALKKEFYDPHIKIPVPPRQ